MNSTGRSFFCAYLPSISRALAIPLKPRFVSCSSRPHEPYPKVKQDIQRRNFVTKNLSIEINWTRYKLYTLIDQKDDFGVVQSRIKKLETYFLNHNYRLFKIQNQIFLKNQDSSFFSTFDRSPKKLYDTLQKLKGCLINQVEKLSPNLKERAFLIAECRQLHLHSALYPKINRFFTPTLRELLASLQEMKSSKLEVDEKSRLKRAFSFSVIQEIQIPCATISEL